MATRRILEQHLPAMTRWVEWCRTHSTDLIRDQRPRQRLRRLALHRRQHAQGPDRHGLLRLFHGPPRASRTGRSARRRTRRNTNKLFQEIKAAFNKRYVTPDGRIHGNTQCCYAMALKFDLLPDELRAKAAQYLEDDIHAKRLAPLDRLRRRELSAAGADARPASSTPPIACSCRTRSPRGCSP